MSKHHLCSRGLPWRTLVVLVSVCSAGVACSSSTDSGGTGGSTASGGAGSSGDPTGGAQSNGGSDVTTGGNTSSSGGAGAQSAGGQGAGGAPETGGADGLGGGTTGGSASGGSAGLGGMDEMGGAAMGGAADVIPTMVSTSDWQFSAPACDLVLDVNPQAGARITSLAVGSTDIIVPYTCASYDGSSACNSSGSTFWTSPQSVWSWPPVVEIDGGPYSASASGSHLLLSGSISAAIGAGVDKDISIDAGSCSVVVVYTIKASQAISAAPWEISRVPRGGLAVFPAGSSMVNSSELTVSESDGYVWLDDSTQTTVVSDGPKIVADGSGGWLAYALNGNLFLKVFADVEPAALAPGEGDVEIYPGSGYLELEPQGPYTAIAANASIDWTVTWRVVAIPSSVAVAVGSATLTDFAQQQATQ